jgi:transcriptional regulator with XRE-family HTH domain
MGAPKLARVTEVDDGVKLVREVERLRSRRGVSKADLARASGLPAQSVRRLLTGVESNPTVDTVFRMLRTMGYRVRLVPSLAKAKARPRAHSQSDLTRAWLARLGAPLYGKSLVEGQRQPAAEGVLARALELAHQDATVARALPVVFMRQRHNLDLDELRRRARRANQARTLGFFLDLTGRLTDDQDLRRAAEPLRPKRVPLTDFFKTRSELERTLAEANTPDVAREWGYRLNMGMDSFESLLAKFRGHKAPPAVTGAQVQQG